MTTNEPVTERGVSVSLDAVLSAVANEQRRAVLRVLKGTNGEAMAASTLADEVADRVPADDGQADDHRQQVRTALHHSHLPKLEACGLVVYESETDQVRNLSGELSQKLLSVVEPYEPQN